MKQPKMIIFDYGQTLVDEEIFDGVKGTEAVFEHAITNKYNLSAEQVQEEAQKINAEIGRFNPNIHPKEAGMIPIWYRGASANSKDYGDVLKINSWTDLKNIIEEAKNNG
ncbi:MAG TPA: hypothetical protein DCW44_08895 [Eubacterium sp.]|nr:hypothetical protein [Eubacterium sp.]